MVKEIQGSTQKSSGSVLLIKCARLPCINGAVKIPIKPASERGKIPNIRKSTKVRKGSIKKTAHMIKTMRNGVIKLSINPSFMVENNN
ncbi:MAG: hypothetical protein ACOC4B_03065 [Bacteroidota bacterium]